MKVTRLILADIKELLENREFVAVRGALSQIAPADLVDGWEHFNRDERRILFKLSPRQRALQLFEELEVEHQEELIESLRAEELEDLMEDLDPAETSRMLRELPKPLVGELEAILRKAGQGEEVEKYLRFPEESVGALMRSNYVSLNPKWDCRQALDVIHKGTRLRLIETMFLDTLFVVDPGDDKLVGTVSLKEIVVAPPEMAVSELMDPDPVELKPEMDREEAAQTFAHYRLGSAAVVDPARRLLGVVLDMDIVEVVEEEIEEDFAKIVGTTQEEFEDVTALESAWHRLPWMAVAGAGQLVVAGVIFMFEGSLSKLVALATFIPLIAAMGGNVGAQSAIIMVHGISSGEFDESDAIRMVFRDLAVGFLLGLAVSVVMVGVSYAVYGARYGWLFAIVTGMGIILSMSVAATLGALVPLAFRRFGVDPATATGPLVTTMTDIIGTAAYLGLASYLLL